MKRMSEHKFDYVDPGHVRSYVENGPPAFPPGYADVFQMITVLLAERMPDDGILLVVRVGVGLETLYLVSLEPLWRFIGVDPLNAMLDLARAMTASVLGERLILIEGTVTDAPAVPFDAAT